MKNLLITGGSKRIGRELALFFGKKGWNIIIHYNSSDSDAEKLLQDLKSNYPTQKFYIIKEDFSSGAMAANALFKKINTFNIKLDLLINNASIFIESSLAETSLDIFSDSAKVNLETPFFLMKNFYKSVKSGVIINILDTRVSNNYSSYGIYSLTKKSLTELTKMAALEWAPNIRVNGVAPGPVLAPVDKGIEHFEKVVEKTPLKKSVKLDNLLNSVYFLVENDSITGQVIYCDSGEHLL